MLVNQQVLDLAFKGFKTVVTDAMMEAQVYADQVAMTVPSASRDETYGWLGSFPAMREWLGPRNVKNLVANGFTIQNRKFESTLEISRDDISDGRAQPFPGNRLGRARKSKGCRGAAPWAYPAVHEGLGDGALPVR